MMKHILFFAAVAVLGLVSSCKKDDAPTKEELIVGRWKATHAFSGSTDVLVPTATLKTELEVEFTADGKATYYWTHTNLNSNPPSSTNSSLNGTYAWNGDEFTITMTAGMDTRSVTGTMEVTEDHFLFTGTSGDLAGSITKIEAEKL